MFSFIKEIQPCNWGFEWEVMPLPSMSFISPAAVPVVCRCGATELTHRLSLKTTSKLLLPTCPQIWTSEFYSMWNPCPLSCTVPLYCNASVTLTNAHCSYTLASLCKYFTEPSCMSVMSEARRLKHPTGILL